MPKQLTSREMDGPHGFRQKHHTTIWRQLHHLAGCIFYGHFLSAGFAMLLLVICVMVCLNVYLWARQDNKRFKDFADSSPGYEMDQLLEPDEEEAC